MDTTVENVPAVGLKQQQAQPHGTDNNNPQANPDVSVQTKDSEPVLKQAGANIPPIRKLATKFQDQVVVVTGAAQGIGAATADSFASQGATVVVVDINKSKLEVTAQSLQDNYPATTVTPFVCDLSNDTEVSNTINSIIASQGHIDILAHIAGIYPIKMITDFTLAEYEQVMQVNVSSNFSLTRHVLPHMRSRGYGRIINTASGLAIHPEAMLGIYSTSKAAVIGFTRATAVEAGPGITVNVVAPGLIYNEHTSSLPMSSVMFNETVKRQVVKRVGLPRDVAEVICFIAIPEAEWITGQVFDVGGGRTFY